ncbi:MAG: hypothetical protein AAGH68_03100 [Pseudomonadota bacterium]
MTISLHRLWLAATAAILLAQSASSAELTGEQKLAVYQSRDLAETSRDLRGVADNRGAVIRALQGLPAGLDDAAYQEHFPEAMQALYLALRSRSVKLPLTEQVHFSVSPTGNRAATNSMRVTGKDVGAPPESLKLWDLDTGSKIAELMPSAQSTTEGATLGATIFSPDGNRLALGVGQSGLIKVWNATDGTELQVLGEEAGRGGSAISSFSGGEGRYLSTIGGGTGIAMRAWDVETGKMVLSVDAETCAFPRPLLHPEEGAIWYVVMPGLGSRCDNKTSEIRRFDPATGENKTVLAVDELEMHWMFSISDDGNLIAMKRGDGDYLVHDLTSGAEISRIPAAAVGWAELRFTPDASMLAGEGESEYELLYFSVDTGERVDPPLDQMMQSNLAIGEDGNPLGWDENRAPKLYGGHLPTGAALVAYAMDQLSAPDLAELEKERLTW